jgi:transposase
MTLIPADLTAFLAEKRDSRAYRRALAVQLALQGYRYEAISDMLDVTPSNIGGKNMQRSRRARRRVEGGRRKCFLAMCANVMKQYS